MRTPGREGASLIFRKELALVSRLPQHARKKKGSHSPGMHGVAAKRPRLEEAMADRTRKTCTGRKWNRTAGESEPKGPSAMRGQLVPSEAPTRRPAHHHADAWRTSPCLLGRCSLSAFNIRPSVLPAVKNLQPLGECRRRLGLWPPR